MAHRWTSARQASAFAVWDSDQEGSRATGESPPWSVGGKAAGRYLFKSLYSFKYPFQCFCSVTSGVFQSQSPPDLKKGQPRDHPSEGAQRKGPGMASTGSCPPLLALNWSTRSRLLVEAGEARGVSLPAGMKENRSTLRSCHRRVCCLCSCFLGNLRMSSSCHPQLYTRLMRFGELIL